MPAFIVPGRGGRLAPPSSLARLPRTSAHRAACRLIRVPSFRSAFGDKTDCSPPLLFQRPLTSAMKLQL